jgi:hypothetical protein
LPPHPSFIFDKDANVPRDSTYPTILLDDSNVIMGGAIVEEGQLRVNAYKMFLQHADIYGDPDELNEQGSKSRPRWTVWE